MAAAPHRFGAYLALVHHPVRSRAGETVTTAITNVDVHDLARTARTYDLAGMFVVTPVEAQRRLAEGILEHWRRGGAGHARVPERTEALERCRVVASVADARETVLADEGGVPRMLGTAARAVAGVAVLPFAEARTALGSPAAPHLLLVGTGHGLTDDLLAECDGLLPPIRPGGYNHLSVRAATAVLLDRLFGDREGAG